MNTCHRTHFEPWIWGITIAAVMFSLLIFSSCNRQETSLPKKKPPMPETPSSTLKMPDPVEFQEIQEEADLPEQLRLGFALDLSGKLVFGDWNVEGKVTATEGRTVAFASDEGEMGHLVYRLPEGLQISLDVDQPISIQRTTRGHGASLGYELLMTSLEEMVVASGRLPADSPLKIEIWGGLSLEQRQERGQMISESEYENTYQVPVILTTDRETMAVSIDELAEVVLQDRAHLVLVSESSELVPTKEHEGVVEGSGYFLEYVVTPK